MAQTVKMSSLPQNVDNFVLNTLSALDFYPQATMLLLWWIRIMLTINILITLVSIYKLF